MLDTEPKSAVTAENSTAILLAEDDPVTRMLMTRFLKKAGYEVVAVADGSQALERMTERYYPILVTDWEMPEMDGVELCKAVRSLQLDGYVYALLLTARDSKENIIAGLEAGADDYLVKPVHEPELVARLNAGRRILALEHSLRAANERNRVLSITDALTGAYNRRYLMEQLPRELERCRRYASPLSVLMCDIDHFKRMNDVQGHAAGDEVLVQFVARVQKSIRKTERLGRALRRRGVSHRAAGNRLRRRGVRRGEDALDDDGIALRDPRRGRRGDGELWRRGDRAAGTRFDALARGAHPRRGRMPVPQQAGRPQLHSRRRDVRVLRSRGARLESISRPCAIAH